MKKEEEMISLLLTLLISTISTNLLDSYAESIFCESSTSLKITRTHLNSFGDELYKEYMYKQGNKIKIEFEYSNGTSSVFLYDGEEGFYSGKPLTKRGSLEMVLYGCTCGYLTIIDRNNNPIYEDNDIIILSGKQGNILVLNARSKLPSKFELKEKVVEFDEYKTIEGFGTIPFLITQTGPDGSVRISRITEVLRNVPIPLGFFDRPKSSDEVSLD
jgi:hypothetical protein